MPTPLDFDGIFYSPDTGSDYIFDLGEEFIAMIKDQSDGLFLSLGAYIDLLINGHADLAERILERARTTWPKTDWDHIDRDIATVKQLAFETKPEGWRHQVYMLIQQTALPTEYSVPADYRSRFFRSELIEAVFSCRGNIVKMIQDGYGDDTNFLILILVDLDMNHQTDLAQEIEQRMREVYPEANWGDIAAIRQRAPEFDKCGSLTPGILAVTKGSLN